MICLGKKNTNMNQIDIVKSVINDLERIDPNDQFAYEKAFSIMHRIPHLPIFMTTITKGMPLFRSRPNKEVDLFKNVYEDLALTPEHFVNGFGRCNRPNQSIFYCSENRPTSYIELVESLANTHQVGETFFITVVRWEIVKPINVLIVTPIDASKRTSEFENEHGIEMDKILSRLNPDIRDASEAFINYIVEKLKSRAGVNSNIYFITSAFTNLCFTHSDQLDGVFYPSVPFAGQGANIALRKSTFQNKVLTPITGIRNQFEVLMNGNGKKNFQDVGIFSIDSISKDGEINWAN